MGLLCPDINFFGGDMGCFESQNGLVQFVFANEDAYFLDSMIRLNLRDYLCHELSRQGYSRIFFIEGIDICMEFQQIALTGDIPGERRIISHTPVGIAPQ